jgi:hypothetical protein
MIADEGLCDSVDIANKVNQYRGQGAELYNGHGRGDLLCIAVVNIGPTAGKHKVRGRADRNELGQPLNYAENYCVDNVH